MITLEQIKKEQEKVNELVRKYEEQQKKKDSYKLEYPDSYTNIFVIRSDGTYYTYTYDDDYKKHFEQGHVKLTKEETALEVNRRDLMTRFNQFRDKCNGGWKPDFTNSYHKHYITCVGGFLKPYWTTGRDYFTKFGYFKSEEDCIKAIELFGDEIKELF